MRATSRTSASKDAKPLSSSPGRAGAALLAAKRGYRRYRASKECFAEFYEAGTRREAGIALGDCLRAIPSNLDHRFAELITACGNWRERILNYLEDPITNAYTESVNSVIRELDRVGRGYKFETMRSLMLYDETIRSKKTSTRSRRSKVPDDVVGFFGIDFEASDDDDLGCSEGSARRVRSLDRIAGRLREPDQADEED